MDNSNDTTVVTPVTDDQSATEPAAEASTPTAGSDVQPTEPAEGTEASTPIADDAAEGTQ